MTKETGGPFYPIADLSKMQCEGITLRDYFAGQALPIIMQEWAKNSDKQWDGNNKTISRVAYLFADAMLAARKDSDEAKAV